MPSTDIYARCNFTRSGHRNIRFNVVIKLPKAKFEELRQLPANRDQTDNQLLGSLAGKVITIVCGPDLQMLPWMTCNGARLAASPRRTGSIKQRKKERNSSSGRAMLFFLFKADHSRFVLTLENILSSERDRLTVEFRDSGFQSGQSRLINRFGSAGRTFFGPNSRTPRARQTDYIPGVASSEAARDLHLSGTKRFVFRRALRTPPFLKYRLPRPVRRPRPMRHVPEAIATLRLDQTHPHSRRPCAP